VSQWRGTCLIALGLLAGDLNPGRMHRGRTRGEKQA
jgi:hypothetical protein